MNTTGYFIAPPELRHHYPSHFQWSGANRILSPPECDALIAQGDAIGWGRGSVGGAHDARVDTSYRCVDLVSLAFSPGIEWLYERVTERVRAGNEAYYGFDLSGLLEPFQLLRYTAPETPQDHAGHYDWHQDFGDGYMGRRKLTVVVQLSDGEKYDGCRLTMQTHRQESMPYTGRGEGVCFPSWTPHCVTPITRGTRYALVAWVHGHPFR